MTIQELARQYCEDHNYDGLVSEDKSCHCYIEDIMECEEETCRLCKFGYAKNDEDGIEAEK